MKLPNFILWLILFLSCTSIYAVNPVSVKQFINHKDWNFVENKGQLTSSEIKYYGHQGGVYLYCRAGKISFVFTKTEKESEQISEATGTTNGESVLSPARGGRGWVKGEISKPSKITTNRADLILINANHSAEIIASDEQEYYENFYLANTPEEGITNVHTFKTITYKNIYPKIDMVLHSIEGGMKYEFVVYPGGKVSDIQLQWEEIETIKKFPSARAGKDSKIEYDLALGNMTESAPFTYQDIANVGAGFTPAQSRNIFGEKGTHKGFPYNENAETKIESHFVLKNNIIRFKIAKYDQTKPLVIDPTLVWGTYFGADGTDECIGQGITTDAAGNVLITGVTTSRSDIASPGAFQANYGGGGEDAFITKFSSNGNRLWSTYSGGDASDNGTGIVTDISGNVYVTGYTYSTSGISSSGAFQRSLDGTVDAFLAKFTSSGIRIWSTYFGGSGYDEGYGIALDAKGNVYITGETGSNNGIAISGAYQTTYGGGTFDAFLAKFSSNGRLSWATYYGGSGADIAHGVSTDDSGNAYIAGFTTSGNGIASSGAWLTKFSNNSSAFLAKFDSSGSISWATYYGETGNEGATGVSLDASGNAYITGSTAGDSGIATSGAYQTSNAGAIDVFIAKFSPSGIRLWGTFFGGKNADFSYGIASNNLGDIFITGYTYSNTDIASQGAYLSTMDGAATVFIAQFSSSGSRIWSTYYGGNATEFGGSIAADAFGAIFITGETNNTSGIATSGAYESTLADGKEAAFIAKFDVRFLNDVGISSFLSPIDSICPSQYNFVGVWLKNYGIDTFVSVTIHWTINGKVQNPFSWSGNILPGKVDEIGLGDYLFLHNRDTIVVWTQLHNAVDQVPENDTAKMVVYFYNDHFPGIGKSNYSICTGSHIRLGNNPVSGYTYSWTSNPAGFKSTLPNPIVNPDSFTTFYLTETNTRTGCRNADSSVVNVKVVKAPVANAGKSHSICFGDSTLIGSSSVSGLSYLWSSYPAGFSSALSEAYVKPMITTIYTVQVTNSTGCTDINNDTITVNNPKAITGPPQSICSGSVINLGTTPIAGHTYSWISKPVGFTSTLSDPMDSPKVSTIYFLTEKISATGCSNTDSILISVIPRPDVKIQTDSIDVFTRKFSAINPNYPANMYKWSISDSDTATGYSLIYTFRNGGVYKAALTVSLPGFCTETDTAFIHISPQFSLNIFPNPFFTQTDIRFILVNPAHIKIQVVDIIGRDISTLVNEAFSPGEYNTFLNATIRPGVYIVIFTMDNNIITRRIVQVGSIFY